MNTANDIRPEAAGKSTPLLRFYPSGVSAEGRAPTSILPNLTQNANVLVVRLRSIGDIVLTLPAIAALHGWRPDLHLRVLVEPPFAALLEGNPAVAEVLLRRGFWPTVGELKRRKFAAAFNLHGGTGSAWLTRCSGAPVRVSWTNQRFSFFYNAEAPPLFPAEGNVIHTAEHRAQPFFWTGLPVAPLPAAKVYPQEDAVAAIGRLLADRGVQRGAAYAVLRPGASQATKRWPATRFAELARWLLEERGLIPVVNLGPGDEGIAGELRQSLPAGAAVLDSLNLRQLIALLAGGRLFVGNDTGPTHIAAALSKPCVVIFGASRADIWHPWKTEHRVVQNAFPCAGCPQGRCASFEQSRCIETVALAQVREACKELLQADGT